MENKTKEQHNIHPENQNKKSTTIQKSSIKLQLTKKEKIEK